MSIASELTRLQTLRNALRTKLVSMLGTSASADFEDCVAAVNGIEERGAVNSEISTKDGEVAIEQGYHNGGGKVKIADAEAAKIIESNIKSGVTILGVHGAYAGESVKLQEKTVTPTTEQQTVQADSGFDGLSTVVMNPIPDNFADVSDVTTEEEHVLANRIFVNAAGEEKAGTMPNNGAANLTIDGLTATSIDIPYGFNNGGTVSLTNDIETALAAI